MKTSEDFREAFPPMDEGFRRAVLHALDETGKERMMVKKKIRVSVVVAAVIVLLAAVALAAGKTLGVFDFMGNHGTPLPQAGQQLQTGMVQEGGELDDMTVTLREAVCDGRYAYMVFDMKPKGNVLLVGEGMTPQDPAWNLSQDLPEDKTIAQWARENHYDRIIEGSVQCVTPGVMEETSGVAMRMADGIVSVRLEGECTGEAETQLAFRCQTVPLSPETGEPDGEHMQEATMTVTLRIDPPLWTRTLSAPVDFAECGVRVDSMTLQGTVMSVYADIDYTVTDANAYHKAFDARGAYFRMRDESGRLYENVTMGGGFVGAEKDRFHQFSDLQAREEPLTDVVLEIIDLTQHNKDIPGVEAHAITLQ